MASGPLMSRLIGLALRRSIPWNVHFDLTYRCNERCVHCYLDHEDYGELTTDEVKAILAQLAQAGTLFLTFSGGEVFLRRDFFELAAYARQLRFDLSLKTNGIVINEERAARLHELGVRKVQISLYSAEPAVHDAITKVPGSWARSLRAIQFLKEQGLQVKIACPVMRPTADGLPALEALAQKLDVPYLLDLTITPKLDGDRSPVAGLRLEKQHLLPILSHRQRKPPAAARSAEVITDSYADIPCSAGHNSCYISPYGDLFPCVQMPLPAGNLRRQRFEEIWYGSPALARVRAIRESQLEPCHACGIRSSCSRCPGLAYLEDGDLLGASRTACELAELRAALAGTPEPISAARKLEQAGGPAQNSMR